MKLFLSVATITVLVFAGVLYVSDRNESGRTDRTQTAAVDEHSSGVRLKPTPVESSRVRTGHDFVPGGIRSVAQFQQFFRTDAALAAQFPDFNFSAARLGFLSKDTCAFVAYRVAAKFGWTRHCIMLRRNEAVLTDGHYTLRARCGNLISGTTKIPLLPQPAQDEIDENEILATPAGYGAAAVPVLADVPGPDSPLSPAPFPVSPGPIIGFEPFPIGPSPVEGPLPPGGFPLPCCGPTPGPISLSVPAGDKYIELAAGLVMIVAGAYYVAEKKRRRR
ncbi:MAG: hypothetical protein ABR874_19420 [Candidatus Sulfotelmatobacter sp.]|jgi:hypothetical protein